MVIVHFTPGNALNCRQVRRRRRRLPCFMVPCIQHFEKFCIGIHAALVLCNGSTQPGPRKTRNSLWVAGRDEDGGVEMINVLTRATPLDGVTVAVIVAVVVVAVWRCRVVLVLVRSSFLVFGCCCCSACIRTESHAEPAMISTTLATLGRKTVSKALGTK